MPKKQTKKTAKYNIAAFFSGVGGIELGFEQTGKFHTVYANEFDANARTTYALNYPETFLDPRDIHEVSPDEIGEQVDLVVGGFPCQAFSIAGYRKGFEDERGDLFFELLRMVIARRPKAVFVENVKNMVIHDHGNTFKVIREALTINGYYIKWKVLNGKDHGNIPQNRERIYIVGFRDKQAFDAFQFPESIDLTTKLDDVIDFHTAENAKYYYTSDKQRFYRELADTITSQETVYQWRRQYVRENKSGVVPTLTANMGMGGHNVPLILSDTGIRKLTPRETFNVQGFPKDFKLPEITDSHLYKQAGNSVVVPVIKRIAENIALALDMAGDRQGDQDTMDGPYAVTYTVLHGKFEGESYVVDLASTYQEAEEKAHQLRENIPLLSDEEYLALIKKRASLEFYSIVQE